MSGTPIIRSGDLRAENRYRLLRTLRRDGPLPRTALGERTGLSAAALSTLIAGLVEEGVLRTDSVRASGALASGGGVISGGSEDGTDASGSGSDDPAKRGPTDSDMNDSATNGRGTRGGASDKASSGRGRRGRPQTTVSLAPTAAAVPIVALTIDRLRAALVDYGGGVIETRELQLDTRALDADTLIETIGAALGELVPHTPGERFELIGVALQGTTDNTTGEMLWSPILGVRDVPLRRALEGRFAAPTRINNDCALIARALHQRHADTLGPDFAIVLFGHGVGLGLTLGGQPFAGIRSSALELGHLSFERGGALCRCGRRGCIEAYAADYGIERTALDGTPDTPPPGRVDPATLDRLITAARAGEPGSMRAFTIAGTAIGEGLADVFTLLDPMPVVLVGGNEEAFALMRDALCKTLVDAGFDAGNVISERDARGQSLDLATDEPLLGDSLALDTLDDGLTLDTLDALDRRIAHGELSPRDTTSTNRPR